jgi:N-acetylmuramoyl-L-alanine amidase
MIPRYRGLSACLSGLFVFCSFFLILKPLEARPTTLPFKGVLLDPGHGGEPGEAAGRSGQSLLKVASGAKKGYLEECYGAITREGYKEKDATLAVSLKVRELLEAQGVAVAMTRSDDRYVGLNERVAKALSPAYRDYVFVSIHFNRSHPQQQAINLPAKYQAPRGFEIFVLPSKNGRSINGKRPPAGYVTVNKTYQENHSLAHSIGEQLASIQGMKNRGIKEAWFVVLRGSPMPAVLIEGGFMSNPEEGNLIRTPAYQQTLARAITTGIMNFDGKEKTRGSTQKASLKTPAKSKSKPATGKARKKPLVPPKTIALREYDSP